MAVRVARFSHVQPSRSPTLVPAPCHRCGRRRYLAGARGCDGAVRHTVRAAQHDAHRPRCRSGPNAGREEEIVPRAYRRQPVLYRTWPRVSSGCFRLVNEQVIDLYQRVPVGTKMVSSKVTDLVPPLFRPFLRSLERRPAGLRGAPRSAPIRDLGAIPGTCPDTRITPQGWSSDPIPRISAVSWTSACHIRNTPPKTIARRRAERFFIV